MPGLWWVAAVAEHRSVETEHIAYIANLAGLTEAWCTAVIRALENRNHGDCYTAHDHYAARVVRPELLKAISRYCWESVLQRVSERQLLGAECTDLQEVQRELGRRLGVHETTVLRWRTGASSYVEADKVLGAVLLALQADFVDVEFHSRATLVPLAARHVLDFIHHELSRKNTKPRQPIGVPFPTDEDTAIERERYYAVSLALADARSDAIVSDALSRDPKRPSPQLARSYAQLLGEVLGEVRRAFPLGRLRDADRLHRELMEWSEPYALFRVGLVSGFVDIDDPDGTEPDDRNEWTWGHVDAG